MSWGINRIERCGGLSTLNPRQRRYVRASLRVMYENGGKIFAHRCFTNASLLSLSDFAYRDGRITASSGTLETIRHGWCEIDNTPFEITFPFVDLTEREARRITLPGLPQSYKTEVRYEWTIENYGRIVNELFQMTHPFIRNLSPEAAATLLEKVECKLGMSDGHIARFSENAREVALESDRILKEGRRPGETVTDFQKRWEAEVDYRHCTLRSAWIQETFARE